MRGSYLEKRWGKNVHRLIKLILWAGKIKKNPVCDPSLSPLVDPEIRPKVTAIECQTQKKKKKKKKSEKKWCCLNFTYQKKKGKLNEKKTIINQEIRKGGIK